MASQYTDRPQTRVVTRAALNNGVHENMSIGQTQAMPPKTKLFDGLSISQVIAGAAAAATSVALASKIGITGSIVGAAVSSVITVISSQVYRHFLTAGARKLKHSDTADVRAALTQDMDRDGLSSVTAEAPAAGSHYANGAQGARVAPRNLRDRAAAERSSTGRRVALFSVLAALIAVVVCTAIVLLSTAGEGLGERPSSFIFPATEEAAAPATDNTSTDIGTQSTQSTSAETSNETSSSSDKSGTASSTDTASDTASPSDSGTNANTAASANSGTSANSSSSSDSSSQGGTADTSSTSSGTLNTSNGTSSNTSSTTESDSASSTSDDTGQSAL